MIFVPFLIVHFTHLRKLAPSPNIPSPSELAVVEGMGWKRGTETWGQVLCPPGATFWLEKDSSLDTCLSLSFWGLSFLSDLWPLSQGDGVGFQCGHKGCGC